MDDTGVVSTRRLGSSTITAVAANGAQTDIVINVEEAKCPVTGITLNTANTVTVKQYEVVQILAQLLPINADNQALIWSSSNASIADVNEDGLVTALNPGTAVITVAAAENSSLFAEVAITVQPIIFEASLEDEISVLAPNSSMVLRPVILPRRHEVQYAWLSSDPSVITVDQNGVVSAVGSGPAVVSVQITDGVTTIELSRTVYVAETTVFVLPAALANIGEEAFMGIAANEIVIGGSAVSIEARAFANNTGLLYVHVPDSVEYIADDAFDGCDYLTLMGSEGGYVQEYAAMHGYYFEVEP